MGKMEVTVEVVDKAMQFCFEAQTELDKLSKRVDLSFGYIGGSWKDKHFETTRKSIDETMMDIDKSFQKLNEIYRTLENVRKIVKDYDEPIV